MAKTEDVAQFLKGTPSADKIYFLSDFHSPSGKIPKSRSRLTLHTTGRSEIKTNSGEA
jgi:hypothetical protein